MLPNLSMLLTAAAALAVVLALILTVGRLAPWLGFMPRPGNGHRLRLEDSIALDPRRRLHLVACDGRLVLLLTGGSADQVVGWLPRPPRVAPDAVP